MTTLDATTYAELRAIAARYPQPRSGLLPMLHLVQSAQGRVTAEGIERTGPTSSGETTRVLMMMAIDAET